MSAESIIVTITNGTTDRTFYRYSQNGPLTRYAFSQNGANDRRFLDIDHRMANTGALGSDVHTLTLRREAIDNDTQKLFVSKVSFQVTVPKTDLITAAAIGDDISSIMSLFNTAFMEMFVQGVTVPGDYNVTGPFVPTRA